MAVALAGGACSAAIPSVDELEISGAIRFSVPRGVIVSSGASGLPVLVTQRGKLCTGDLPDRVATGEDIDIVDAVPVAELSLDCVDFADRVFLPVWSPDSTRIAFMGVSSGSESDIWVYDTVGGAVTNLSGDAGEDTLPLWADDRTLVFLRTLDGDLGVETTWQAVSIDSGVPALVAVVAGSVELNAGATVIRGESPRIVFNLISPDGIPAGIHQLVIGDDVAESLYLFDDQSVEAGFELLDVHPDGTLALVAAGTGGLGTGHSYCSSTLSLPPNGP